MLEHGLSLWFDRPYDIGLKTTCFAGYIREGEPWTMEILHAMVGACGIICFPSEAASRSDECRLEFALGRVFGAVSSFKIFPVLLDDASFQFLDHRVAQTQGRKIYVTHENPASELTSEAQRSLLEFSVVLEQHAMRFTASGGFLQALYTKFAATQQALSASRTVVSSGVSMPCSEFGQVVEEYRNAKSWQSRHALDQRLAIQPRPYSLSNVLSQVAMSADEATAMAAAMSLARRNTADCRDDVGSLARELLRFDSERVRFRVGEGLLRRAQARLIDSEERSQLLCILEASIALEKHSEVLRALKRSRDAIAAV
jgi:hypothetical protein